MAELILRIGDNPNEFGFKDGDIMHGHNDRRIHCVGAEDECHVKKMPFNSDGLNPIDCLADVFQKNTYQYKTFLTGKTITRITLSDMSEEDVSSTFDGEDYVRRRITHARHRIFGTKGNEYWYGGRTTVTNAILTTIWNRIENDTGKLKADCVHDWGKTPMKTCFVIRVDDFTNEERALLEAPEYDNIDPENPVMIKKRKRMIDWESLASMSAATITKIRDTSQIHDSRTKFSYIRADEVIEKA